MSRQCKLCLPLGTSGRRESGLERGEYDQGQHDRIRVVLGVNTAWMLVRRHVLERIGFDPRLPFFGNDIDLGWRAARAGYRTLVVPDAVLFRAIRKGRVSVVTDLIVRFVENGIKLRSGAVRVAEILVTATGLVMRLMGGSQLAVEGEPVVPPSTML